MSRQANVRYPALWAVPPTAPRARGLSLVEMMVALTIGIIVLAAVGQIFISSRGAYMFTEGAARVQEGGRFAVEFLAYDVRMAGYAGCSSDLPPDKINNIAKAVAGAPNLQTQLNADGIVGHRYAGPGTNNRTDWNPDLPAEFFIDGDVKAGTDVLMIYRASTLDAKLAKAMNQDTAQVHILVTSELVEQIEQDDILVLSDCQGADVFRVTGVSSSDGKRNIAHGSGANTDSKLSKQYSADAQLMMLVARAYYIGVRADGEPALMRRETQSGASATTPPDAEELIGDVEDMRFLYGVDTDSNNVPNRYVLADAVTDRRRVIAVRVGLLLRTPEVVGQEPDTRQYTLVSGQTAGPFNDRRRRQVFGATLLLRNRIN